MEHILLSYASNYKQRKHIEPPLGYTYDNVGGAWVNTVDSTLLVNDKDWPQTGTKKHDVETGEDLKGQ